MLLNFNAASVPPAQPLDVMPAGWYNAKITAMETKPTKDHATSGGEYIKVEFTIIDGKFANRKVWTNLNVKNSNPEAVRIAYEQLSAICHAVNRIQVADAQELYGLPMQIKLSVRAASAEHDAQNEVKGFKACEGAGGAASGGPSGPPSSAPASAPAPGPTGAPTSAPAVAASVVSAPAVAAPAAVAHDPLAAAVADGWAQHPEHPTHYWKGSEALPVEEVLAKYPAPAPAAVSAPAVSAPAVGAPAVNTPAVTGAPAADGGTEKAPWE